MATQTLRRWLFFWQPRPRPAEAEESLTALLARRDTVRSKQTAPAIEPNPELFRPQRPAAAPLPGGSDGTAAPETAVPAATSEPPKPDGEPASTTTSRLLEAKRRAQKRRG